MNDFEAVGGAEAVSAIIRDFIERVYADAIIGFFFVTIDKERLILRESQLAAAHLGGPQEYSGRPIHKAHARHPINRGQFRRRLYLLEKTLDAHGVPADIKERWLDHDRRLESAVTDGRECID
jgi:hemoglobin